MIIINYQINSARNRGDCVLLEVLKSEQFANWKVQDSSEKLWARNKNKIIMSLGKMVVLVPSGLKNLRIYETIYFFPEHLGKGISEDTKDIFV